MYSQEFFNNLKSKLKDDLKRFFEIKGLGKDRLDVLKEVYKSLDIYRDFLEDKVNPKTPLQKIREFGEKNNWPAMVMEWNKAKDKPTKILGSGKESWENAMALCQLNEPYKSNFNDLVNAVDRKDIWQTKS